VAERTLIAMLLRKPDKRPSDRKEHQRHKDHQSRDSHPQRKSQVRSSHDYDDARENAPRGDVVTRRAGYRYRAAPRAKKIARGEYPGQHRESRDAHRRAHEQGEAYKAHALV